MKGNEAALRILVVEDDETLRESLRYTLALEGYDVRAVADGLTGLRSADENPPSAIVLDLMLPGMDGLEVCRQVRRKSQVPIMMLTAKKEEVDKVVGLEVGADDYMTKPFSMRELVARVRALLRRAKYGGESPQESAILHHGVISVDTRRREVTRDGALVALRPKEYDLLAFLARNPGQVFSRQQLLDQVWGYEFFGGGRTVDVHVRWLREKIERDPSNPELLHTVRGAGYRLDA